MASADERRSICSVSTAGRRERDHITHDLRRVGRVVHQRLGADGDPVAEDGGHLVGMTRAAHVAQQRHPMDGVALCLTHAGLARNPGGEQARPQLRLQGLAEGVVLRQRLRRNEFTKTEE